MLQDGGNPWRGMVYGITNRAGWGGDPTAIWKFWDEYKIEEKVMIGYWDEQSPAKVDNSWIRVTLYKGREISIIAAANWDNKDQECTVHLDWDKLGYDSDSYGFQMPFVQNFQNEKTLQSLERIVVPAGKGYLVVIKNR